ncbi:MAG: phosphomannomutase/phosphoglucomutase [Candidatus Dadabacteria bacterium]|nr:phosphomannomutase/phosphoglucomutase [Candidatus Dadabacteria bacterium]
MIPDKSIFREYDIRGIAGESITEEVVEIIGKAYGTMIAQYGGAEVSVGYDCRKSSPSFRDALCKGIVSTGLNVVDIGMVTTPMVYFSTFTSGVDGGVMVTASHNPSEYNGLKMCVGRNSLFGKGIQKIKKEVEKGKFKTGKGRKRKANIVDSYLEFLEEKIHIKPGIKVAADGGNGTAGVACPEILRRFGCELHELYMNPDGDFPNHHPDPTVEENLSDIKKKIAEAGLDVGLAFDGDADRIGIVDERGRAIRGDMLLLVYSLDLLQTNPGATIIGDVKCSGNLFSQIRKAGGNPIMWKTGHSVIKDKMKKEGAELGGEMSGHIFFKNRFFGYDDALYAGLRFLEILSKTGKKTSELLAGLPKTFATPEIRIDCPDEIKFQVTETVKGKLAEQHEVIDIDGVRVEYPDGWGLLRASNTEPALVLRFEAQTEPRLAEIRENVERILKETIGEIS